MSLLLSNLLNYIKTNDLAAVRTIIESNEIVDAKDGEGQTPLMHAVSYGYQEIAKLLLMKNASYEEEDDDKWTALLIAAKNGDQDIVHLLLREGADIEHKDSGGWTALMWACYKGKAETVQLLLTFRANPNVKVCYGMTALLWAAGRGHSEVVALLLKAQVKPDSTDKQGTTGLIWAARKGHLLCVKYFLNYGADIDAAGMYSWTALFVATLGGHTQVVKLLLSKNPNVNTKDQDGHTPLYFASKNGNLEIVKALINKGAFINVEDRMGDSILISAVKSGHIEVVQVLLEKYADVDMQGNEKKTALYWAVDKRHIEIVKAILKYKPDMEIKNKAHETALIRAVKNRDVDIVSVLLANRARVSAFDKNGDTPLHMAVTGQHKKITELLLRNPKDGKLLYRPNKNGKTPYDIDCENDKSILTQIYAARNFSMVDQEQHFMGDMYSSCLAEFLSERTLATPLTVGLFARWGSGKSFFLRNLRNEVELFSGYQGKQFHLAFSWPLLSLHFLVCAVVSLVAGFSISYVAGLALGLSLFFLTIAFFGYTSYMWKVKNHRWARRIGSSLARFTNYMELIMKVCFCNPVQAKDTRILPVRFFFADFHHLNSMGSESSLAKLVGTLSDVVESEIGYLVTRLYRVFKTEIDPEKRGKVKGKWKTFCNVPIFVFILLVLASVYAAGILLGIYGTSSGQRPVQALLITAAVILGLSLIFNSLTIFRVLLSLAQSQHKRVSRAAANFDLLHFEGFMRILKREVEILAQMVQCIDAFSYTQTRLVVFVNGLDSCEHEKVLQILDTVQTLFSATNSPFVIILAIDPHITIKAIEQNMDSVFRESNINGHDYLRNIIQMPFFMDRGRIATVPGQRSLTDKQDSSPDTSHSNHHPPSLQKMDSVVSEAGSNNLKHHRSSVSVFNFSKMFVRDSQMYGELNPRSFHRLLNIVSIIGRLLWANYVEFQWLFLTSWVYLTEEWPYRTSWLIFYYQEHFEEISSSMPLKELYEIIFPYIPVSKEREPLLDLDSDIRNFYLFLIKHKPPLTVGHMNKFLPYTISLDPHLRKIIADVHHSPEGMLQSHPAMTNSETVPVLTRLQDSPWHLASDKVEPPQSSQPPATNAAATQHDTPTSDLSTTNGGMSIKDICDCLLLLEGMDQNMVPLYQARIAEHNINGHVLLQCDLGELQGVLGMTFGDWQLFRALVLRMREERSSSSSNNLSSHPDRCTPSTPTPVSIGHSLLAHAGRGKTPPPPLPLLPQNKVNIHDWWSYDDLHEPSPYNSPKLGESPLKNRQNRPLTSRHLADDGPRESDTVTVTIETGGRASVSTDETADLEKQQRAGTDSDLLEPVAGRQPASRSAAHQKVLQDIARQKRGRPSTTTTGGASSPVHVWEEREATVQASSSLAPRKVAVENGAGADLEMPLRRSGLMDDLNQRLRGMGSHVKSAVSRSRESLTRSFDSLDGSGPAKPEDQPLLSAAENHFETTPPQMSATTPAEDEPLLAHLNRLARSGHSDHRDSSPQARLRKKGVAAGSSRRAPEESWEMQELTDSSDGQARPTSLRVRPFDQDSLETKYSDSGSGSGSTGDVRPKETTTGASLAQDPGNSEAGGGSTPDFGPKKFRLLGISPWTKSQPREGTLLQEEDKRHDQQIRAGLNKNSNNSSGRKGQGSKLSPLVESNPAGLLPGRRKATPTKPSPSDARPFAYIGTGKRKPHLPSLQESFANYLATTAKSPSHDQTVYSVSDRTDQPSTSRGPTSLEFTLHDMCIEPSPSKDCSPIAGVPVRPQSIRGKETDC